MTFAPDLFAGRHVVVLGGTSGIGGAAALRFAELGATVRAGGLKAHGPEAPKHANLTCDELDVLTPGALEAFFATSGPIHALINCVGVSRDRQEWTQDKFNEVIAINLISVMNASRLARPLIEKGGAIVNIASMYATFGAADRPAYSASKGGIVQLTKSLAQEYAADGIRVNAVAPGWIVTPLSRGLFADAEASDPIKARIPFKRWGEAAEVADPIVFLCTDAARYMTGVSIAVDGGYQTS